MLNRNDNYNKYSYNNLSYNYNESIARPVNNIELPNTSSLFNESATGSGLPEESNVVDLNDEYVEYSAPAYTGKARKSSAKGSSLVNNTNN